MFCEDTEIACSWGAVVERVKRGDQSAGEDLYCALSRLVGATLLRVVGPQGFEDSLHEILVIVLETIKGGGLRDSDRILGFMRTVARRRMVAHIRSAISQRRRFGNDADFNAIADDSPEKATNEQRIRELRDVLRQLSLRDQEIIERFYFREQDRAQICDEMRLSDTQFRLYKSRALAKCSRLARAASLG